MKIGDIRKDTICVYIVFVSIFYISILYYIIFSLILSQYHIQSLWLAPYYNFIMSLKGT